MPGQQAGIGHVGQAIPLHGRTGKDERATGLAAQGSVDRQGDAHVHGVADSIADNRVGPVDTPSEPLAFGRGKHLIFLSVIKIGDIQASLFFAKRCRGQGAVAIGLERPEIVFEPGNQRYMLHGAGRLDGLHQIAHHGSVDPDVFSFRRLSHPRGEKHMGRFYSGQGGLKRLRVKQIGRKWNRTLR